MRVLTILIIFNNIQYIDLFKNKSIDFDTVKHC